MMCSKIRLLFLCLSISINLVAQEVTESMWRSSKYGEHFGLSVTHQGDINSFLLNLKKEFGKPSMETSPDVPYNIEFENEENINWSDEKIVLHAMIMSNNNIHNITVGCLTRGGNDLLMPKTKTQTLIAEFLINCLK